MLFSFSPASRKFKAKVNELRPSLVNLAFSWCGDKMLAEDLVQNTIVKALHKNHQIKDIKKIKCWMYSILNNCWREHLRNQKPTDDIDDMVIVSDINLEFDINTQQIIERVRLAVSKLPLGQRQVITLVDLEEFSYADVATTLEIPTGTVMSRLSRARANLKISLLSYHSETNHKVRKLRSVK